jgi:Hsp70 protein
MPNFTFGLDFGTSKTAITLAPTGVINPTVSEVTIDGQNDRIATFVLRIDGEDGQVFIGQAAEQELMAEQDPAVRKRMEFFSNFKPHIHRSADYRKIARQFMTALRKSDGLAQEFERHFGDAIVAVGCPVSWVVNGAQQTLLRVLDEAGFPPAFAVPEPVGAAFHFLGGRLKAQDFHNTIVVIDWGAGTFDMTVLRAGRIAFEAANSWGSTLYGGGLFDDLFYQWLLEIAEAQGHGADVRKLEQSPVDRAILHGLMSRQIKESFSRFYANNGPDKRWTYGYPVAIIGSGATRINLGNFEIPRIGQFDERMRAYRVSAMARPWLEMAQAEVQPEEREFFDALRDGRAVDLQAWGRRLIEVGLRRLAIDEKSIAVLTGGSCNWKWFQDEVLAQAPFKGRSLAVHIDGKPELTIARGLARAYAVGSYTTQLIDQVRAARATLMAPLQKIHAEILEQLSYSLTSVMKLDETLTTDLRRIFEDALNRAALARGIEPRPTSLIDRLLASLRRFWAGLLKGPPKPGGIGKSYDYQEWFRGAFDELLKDPNLDAIRPDLERRIGQWLGDNRGNLQGWDQRFALRAHRRIMELLKAHIHAEIGGFVEVAIEACSAIGATTFDVALKDLGGKVKFSPGMIGTLFDEMTRRVRALAAHGAAAGTDKAEETRRQAGKSTEQLFDDLPSAIRRNLEQVQPAAVWAEMVIDDLIETLQTLARIARVDAAPENSARSRTP